LAAWSSCCAHRIDVKNINLQIKNMFFHFYKNIKNMHKTLNYSTHSSKMQRQYEPNKVNNTATKHSLCPGCSMANSITRPQATQFCTFMF